MQIATQIRSLKQYHQNIHRLSTPSACIAAFLCQNIFCKCKYKSVQRSHPLHWGLWTVFFLLRNSSFVCVDKTVWVQQTCSDTVHIRLNCIKVILTHIWEGPLLKKYKYGNYVDPLISLKYLNNNISYHIITKYSLYSGLHTLPGTECLVITEVPERKHCWGDGSLRQINRTVKHFCHVSLSTAVLSQLLTLWHVKPLPFTLDMHCPWPLPQQDIVFCHHTTTITITVLLHARGDFLAFCSAFTGGWTKSSVSALALVLRFQFIWCLWYLFASATYFQTHR